MIGVIANPADQEVVAEFFQLFKTPWEIYRSNRRYDVVVCTSDVEFAQPPADTVIYYGGRELPIDSELGVRSVPHGGNGCVLFFHDASLPIYGRSVEFYGESSSVLVNAGSRSSAICLVRVGKGLVARIGYDLFSEIRSLLTVGQAVAYAGIPSLELHIALLREVILAGGVPLVEIPPIPEGFRFVACLTHDVDHPFMCRHKFDHTMFGFLYRATLGSILDAMRGRSAWNKVLKNWAAALKLPFVFAGLAKDEWAEFDHYTSVEQGVPSTFFVIPYQGYPGKLAGNSAPGRRAAGYAAADVSPQIQRLISAGCEVGLHGIDAWQDSDAARAELAELREVSGCREVGVRMHWLYFNDQSPRALDAAGADYDSTLGYNDTVGYRSGTTQVYKPLGVSRLLELPLHIMDTAMFFPSHLHLTEHEARERVRRLIENAMRYGGCVTVNWHDRSLFPERCWGGFYSEIIEELRNSGAWFATGAQAVSWFRKRRAATFSDVPVQAAAPSLLAGTDLTSELPSLCLTVHRASNAPADEDLCIPARGVLPCSRRLARTESGLNPRRDTEECHQL